MRRKYKYQVLGHPMVPVLRRRKISPARHVAVMPTVSSEQVAQLKERYTFRREQEVVQYLRLYPFLVEMLMEAREVVRQFFGEGTDVVLEVITDYEDRTWRELCILVCVDWERSQAWARLDELDKKWWYGAMERAKYKLNIELEFVHV